jgi:hypothetical protein
MAANEILKLLLNCCGVGPRYVVDYSVLTSRRYIFSRPISLFSGPKKTIIGSRSLPELIPFILFFDFISQVNVAPLLL